MSRRDWFRKTTWTHDDREDFFTHLRRSRAHNRPQYLRIQAVTLQQTGNRDLIQAALKLQDLYFRDYPNDDFLAWVYEARAECFSKLGRVDEALEAWQNAFDAMRKRPNIKINDLGFCVFVLEHKLANLYPEVLQMLREYKEQLLFPVQEYYYFGVLAILASRLGDSESARRYASRALSASSKTFSSLPRHPTFGLVENKNSWTYKELKGLISDGALVL